MTSSTGQGTWIRRAMRDHDAHHDDQDQDELEPLHPTDGR